MADVGWVGQWGAGDGPGRVREVEEKSEAWGRRKAEEIDWVGENEPRGRRSDYHRGNGMANRCSVRWRLKFIFITLRFISALARYARPVPDDDPKLLNHCMVFGICYILAARSNVLYTCIEKICSQVLNDNASHLDY